MLKNEITEKGVPVSSRQFIESQINEADGKIIWIGLRMPYSSTMFYEYSLSILLLSSDHKIMHAEGKFSFYEDIIVEVDQIFEAKDKSCYKSDLEKWENNFAGHF